MSKKPIANLEGLATVDAPPSVDVSQTLAPQPTGVSPTDVAPSVQASLARMSMPLLAVPAFRLPRNRTDAGAKQDEGRERRKGRAEEVTPPAER